VDTTKEAFNKNNPTELLGQLVAVLRKEGLDDVVATLKSKGVTRLINDAWMNRKKRRSGSGGRDPLVDSLVYLAHENPSARSQLLPLIKRYRSAAGGKVDAQFWVEPKRAKNISVKEYGSDGGGTSGRSGAFVLSGTLKVQPKGYRWVMEVPFTETIQVAEEPRSGTIAFSSRGGGLSQMIVTAIGDAYETENAVMRLIGKVPYVPDPAEIQ